MDYRPFAEQTAALAPDLWANYVRSVERNRQEGGGVFRVTCTCHPSELLACAYCRCEYYRTLRLAMLSPAEAVTIEIDEAEEREGAIAA